MVKSRKFWLLVIWVLIFGAGTGWVAVEGGAPFGSAALVGAVAASALTALAARIGR